MLGTGARPVRMASHGSNSQPMAGRADEVFVGGRRRVTDPHHPAQHGGKAGTCVLRAASVGHLASTCWAILSFGAGTSV